jgi:hypothetical protein
LDSSREPQAAPPAAASGSLEEDRRIGLRTGLARVLLVALAGTVVSVTALRVALHHDDAKGRIVQTRMANTYRGDPVAFPLDEMYVSPGSDGRLRAFYVYPPGFYGHARGCKVVWVEDDAVGGSVSRPGHFVDPCGGARFDRDGRLVQGPADRGLDYFETRIDVGGTLVDTRTLYCGQASSSATPATATTERRECDRVSPSREFR